MNGVGGRRMGGSTGRGAKAEMEAADGVAHVGGGFGGGYAFSWPWSCLARNGEGRKRERSGEREAGGGRTGGEKTAGDGGTEGDGGKAGAGGGNGSDGGRKTMNGSRAGGKCTR
ncbi:unnamed protein product, partial [Dovyalis caffra]